MGDSLYEMSVFSKVVATGSLSAAARDLGVSTAVVSRRLAAGGIVPEAREAGGR